MTLRRTPDVREDAEATGSTRYKNISPGASGSLNSRYQVSFNGCMTRCIADGGRSVGPFLVLVRLAFGLVVVANAVFVDPRFVHWVEPERGEQGGGWA